MSIGSRSEGHAGGTRAPSRWARGRAVARSSGSACPGVVPTVPRFGVSVFCMWIANALLGLFFPSLVAGLGLTGSFFILAALNLIALIFVRTSLPETRGRTLESVEEDVTTGAIYTISKTGAQPVVK